MAADYIIQNSNNFEKKSFLSSDANILVDGTKEIRIGALARYALSNWSVSFSVTKLSASGNTYFTQSGGITIDDTVLSNLDTDVGSHVIITSGGTIYYDGYPLTTGAGLGNLLNAQITIGTGNFVISNICLFDTVVNDIQATQQDDYKGTVPESLQANCVGFWTCQSQFSREIITGDEALNKGLSLGNLALWDSSEMFNPSKITALVANHGNLYNFTDVQVGTDGSEEATSIKDFYCPDVRYKPVGKKYDSPSTMRDSISGFVETDLGRLNSYTYLIKNDNRITSTSNETFFSTGDTTSGTTGRGIQIYLGSTGVLFVRYSNTSSTNDLLFRTPIPKGVKIIAITYTGSSTVAGFEIYYDNVLQVKTINRDNLTATVNTTSNQFNLGVDSRQFSGYTSYLNRRFDNLEIISGVASASEIEQASKCGSFEGLGKTYLLNVDFSKQTSSPTDLTGTYTINSFKSGLAHTVVNGDGTYLEAKTNLPPIGECLKLTGTQYIEYPTTNLPNNTEDFTLFSSGWITNVAPSSVATNEHFEFLLNLGDKNVTTSFAGAAERISHFWAYKSGAVVVNKEFWNQYRQQGVFNQKDITNQNQYLYFVSAATVVKDNILINYVNGIEVSRTTITSKLNPSTFITPVFRTGYQNWENSPTVKSEVSEMYISSMLYWKGRALDGWEIHEIYKNSILGSPFAWTTSQNTGFADNLEMAYQFQNGAISWDGANWKLKNWGSGADATINGYNAGTAGLNSDFSADNVGSIVDIDSLR